MRGLSTINRQEGSEDIQDDEVGYSHREWNPYVAYGVRFSEVALRTPGNMRMVTGDRYYEHPQNLTERSLFLKLHGSLGWYYRSGYRLDGERLSEGLEYQEYKTVIRRSAIRFPHHEIDYAEGETLLPLIITPILHKSVDEYSIFREIWRKARNQLKKTKKLVIIGYSFSPTDFHVRYLLREVFCDRSHDEVCVVDPDPKIASLVKDLCHFSKEPLVYKNIGEYMRR